MSSSSLKIRSSSSPKFPTRLTDPMSSSSASGGGQSANWRKRGGERARGFPRICRWCGEASVIRTSKTVENPGRLFHCCPNGPEKDKNHLFKWTDKSVVEEIEDLKEMFGGLKSEVKDYIRNLELESRTSEAIVASYENKIQEMSAIVIGYEKEMQEMSAIVHGFEKEIKDCIGELRSLKNMLVIGFGMVVFYFFIKT